MYQYTMIESLCEQSIGWIHTGMSAYMMVMPWYLPYQLLGTGISDLGAIQKRF